ncbi:hypothetical protein F5Y08DRAFT_274563 [Xylaria arbuscula]|nr:hypothetical protein F5Y08DRAFT_274563 [Xylaria arbuscula]
MAGLARVARPWLLPPLRRPIRAPAIAPPHLRPGYSRGIKAVDSRGGAKPQVQQNQDKQNTRRVGSLNFLLPYTIVPPPIWRFPLSPTKFAHMVYLLAKNRLVAFGSLVGLYMVSITKPSGKYGMPQFRARRSAAVPAAKALHLQMSEAVAAGDKETLRRVCNKEFFVTLAGAVDARPRGQRAEWELVRYEDKLRYPRLADFRVMYQPGASGSRKGMHLVKQAVVSISSVQRIARYDGGGKGGDAKIPGSEREQHMMEHIVLQAEVNEKTWTTGPWQIWGTLPEMPYEKIRNDEALVRELS